MSTITFDNLKFVEKLKSAGIPEAQAKAEVEALAAALQETAAGLLATRDDIHRIERKLVEHDGEFKSLKWMLGIIVVGVVMLVLKSFT
jgi:hypothetical protein